VKKDAGKIEELFSRGKAEIDNLQIPDQLEMRLRKALDKAEPKPLPFYQRYNLQLKLAAVFMILLLVGFNYNAIASYGKQLFGYEEVMNGTLRELNNLGKGQAIGKTHTFPNGVSITVDYLMLDENQLLLFYTVKDPAGQASYLSPHLSLQGLFGEYRMRSAEGLINEDDTEVKCIGSFAPPSPLVKKLTLRIALMEDPSTTLAEIPFTLDRSTAMASTLKKKMDLAVKIDQKEVKFESILASPTQTTIKGSVQGILGLAYDVISGERFRPQKIELKLYANGQEVEWRGGGISTDMKGITFHSEFDALPTPLTDLKLELVSLIADNDVNERFKLEKDQVLEILGQNVMINDIRTSQNETFITITSQEDLTLTKVYLIADGRQIPLEETVDSQFNKSPEGEITHTRTLRFLGTGEDLLLEVKSMSYAQYYNQLLQIPLD